MPYNVRRLRSRTQVSTFNRADAGSCPYDMVGTSSHHHGWVPRTSEGKSAFSEIHSITRLWAVGRSASRRWMRLVSDGFKSALGPVGIGSKNRRPAKFEHSVRGQASGGLPARLKLHARHSVLRKVSTALRVRINPSMDELGPYVVIDDVTSADVLIIAQILED
jgi:hypothetical protein